MDNNELPQIGKLIKMNEVHQPLVFADMSIPAIVIAKAGTNIYTEVNHKIKDDFMAHMKYEMNDSKHYSVLSIHLTPILNCQVKL